MTKQNEGKTEGSLADFSFDSQEEWFGVKTKAEDDTDTSAVIKEVKSKSNDASSSETTNLDEEDNGDDSDFFMDEIEEEEKPEKGTKKEKTVKKEAEEEVEEEDEVDNDEEDEVDDKSTKTKKEKTEDVEPEDETEFYTTLSKELKERGVFQAIDIKDDEKIDVEKFFELHDKEIEARVDETFEAFSENLEDEEKQLIKYIRNGGKASKFTEVGVVRDFNIDEFDEDDDKQVQAILKYHVTNVEGLEGEEIEDRLTYIKDGGKEKSLAKRWFNKHKAERDARVAELFAEQEEATKKKEKAAKKFNETMVEVLEETDEVGVVPISKEDKKDLNPYITKPTVRVGKNVYIPQLQADLTKILLAKTKEDQQLLIALSKAVKNKFNLKDVKTKAKTEATKTIKSNLYKAKTGGLRGKTSGSSARRSLEDYF